MPLSLLQKSSIAAAFTLVAGGIIGSCSYSVVPPKHFGVKVTWGQVEPETYAPGPHAKNPLVGKFYDFNNNVVILETSVGSGKNTKDQNSYRADIRVHYNIKPDAGILAFHLNEMGNDDGKQLLIEQLDKSMNAVVGQRTTPESLVTPDDVLKGLLSQIEWRLKQNNIALQIDTIEMLTQYVGDGQTPLRLPVQLKIKPGSEVESMAGPSVPVEHLMIVKSPAQQPAAPAAPAMK